MAMASDQILQDGGDMSAGMIAAVAAVMVDSVVTVIVGWRLQHMAREQIAQGVDDIMQHAPEILAKSLQNGSDDGKE